MRAMAQGQARFWLVSKENSPLGFILEFEEPAQLPNGLRDLFLGISMDRSEADDGLERTLPSRVTIGLHRVEGVAGGSSW